MPSFTNKGWGLAWKVTVTLRDAEGQRATVTFYAPSVLAGDPLGLALFDDGKVEAVVEAIQSLTNAQVVKYSISIERGFNEGLGSTQTYQNAEDKAVLVFANTTTGRGMQMQVPAPSMNTLFTLTDQETVDAAAGDDFASILHQNDVCDADGQGAGDFAYLRGYLSRKPASKQHSPGWATEVGGD